MKALSVRELLAIIETLLRQKELSAEDQDRFSQLRKEAEGRTEDFGDDSSAVREVERLRRSIDMALRTLREARVGLNAEATSYAIWAAATAESLALLPVEGSSKIAKKKKKKESARLEKSQLPGEIVAELRELLTRLAFKVRESSFFARFRDRLASLTTAFTALLARPELSPQLCRGISESIEVLLATKGGDFDCEPLRLCCLGAQQVSAKPSRYVLSLLEEKEAACPAFVEQFKEGHKALVGDDELTPFSRAPQPRSADSVFPAAPALSLEALRRLDAETLLVVFHFSPREYERLVAANQLKQREWRFHAQFNVWMKRAAPPLEQSARHERGDYHLFDWEEKLAVKRITDMTVDYSQLESARSFN